MKSINSRITIILVIGFLLQVIILGSFYQLTLTKKIIYEINNTSNNRQTMLKFVVSKIEKTGEDLPKIQKFLLQYSQNHNVDFRVKDLEGKLVYITTFTNNMSGKIEDRAFVEFKGKPTYVIFAYFPTNMDSILSSVKGNDTKMILGIIVLVITAITSFVIYLIIGAPLKKLRKAMVGMEYGNTEVKIPYEAKDEVGLLCRNFEDMGQRLKKSEEDQSQLISAISHDLKTPLTSILGYVTRLCDGKVNSDEKRYEYYDIIRRKTLDLKYLIGELSDFSSFSGKEKYFMNKLDFSEFFYDITREFESEAVQKGKKLIVINKIVDRVFTEIDENKIRRVFTNTWSNALKYAGEEAEIEICSSVENRFIVIEVSDNGTGVPDDDLEKIFGRFFRVETSRSREKGGTGLGLAICKDIVEKHGGKIWAENNEKGGLSVIFSLPIAGDK